MLLNHFSFIVVAMFSFVSLASDIHTLARDGDWFEALELVREKNSRVNELDEETGETLLDIALHAGAYHEVNYLLLLGGLPGTTVRDDVEAAEEMAEGTPALSPILRVPSRCEPSAEGSEDDGDLFLSGEWDTIAGTTEQDLEEKDSSSDRKIICPKSISFDTSGGSFL